ncbi:MAG TPA: acetoacetate--CoA ligase [Nevskiales bacterium]|nr:acetoacetate--CoA ligase [Nevskiales bacterium]
MPTRVNELPPVKEGDLLWTPSPERVAGSAMMHFMRWVERERGLRFDGDYETLRRWSVDHLEEFWGDCWRYFDVMSDTPFCSVLSSSAMPGATWFEGATINYAEHLLRPGAADETAIVHLSELREAAGTSREALRAAVRIMASRLRELGIGPGDRVVSYMPNVIETVIAFLATAAVGAVWSSAAPEFGVQTVLDRFAQIEPKLVFAADGYRFGGKDFDRSDEVRRIVASLPGVEHVIWLPYLNPTAAAPIAGAQRWSEVMAGTDPGPEEFSFARVPPDHPLWIVYSSGTTGLPKPIVHGHVGALLEACVLLRLHSDLGPGKRMFFYTTTGWIMWNITVAALVTGASIVLYDGHPSQPQPDLLWKMAAEQEVTLFGASPTYVQMMQKAGLRPKETFDLTRLDTVMLTGSPATPETFAWFYRDVKDDLWIASVSGGTDIAGGFVGSSPTLPVYAGEIQCRMLGKDIQAWNDAGKPLIDEIGELVCTNPIPSMPVYFWGDAENARYRESYFDHFPGVWRHGDFLKINARGGCHIYGRSDSTLNRYGVRIGTAEIYRVVEQVEGVVDSLIVCCDLEDGKFFMPMFLVLRDGVVMDEALRRRIESRLRSDCSPRHVPDSFYAVDAIPYTLTGKKMEVPVRKILMGWPAEKAANRDAMRNPQALEYFVRFARECPDYEAPGRR